MAKVRRSALAPSLVAIVVVIAIDQASKLAVAHSFAYGERRPLVAGWLDLILLYNPGAAFNFLSDAGGWQRWFFTAIGIVAAVFIVFMLARHGSQRLFCAALVLIAGGALGNVIDRLVHGHVVDFILVYHGTWTFPAFNAADSAITVGAVLLVLDEIARVRRAR